MIFKFIVMLMLFSSCAYFGGRINQALIDSGHIKTVKNQNLPNLLNDGKLFIAGKIDLYFEGKKIEGVCSIALNELVSRTGVAFYQDDKFLASEVRAGSNRLVELSCGVSEFTPAFKYEFNDLIFKIDEQISYFGLVEIHFSNERGDDGRKRYALTKPSIKNIILKDDDRLLREIVTEFKLKDSSKIKRVDIFR